MHLIGAGARAHARLGNTDLASAAIKQLRAEYDDLPAAEMGHTWFRMSPARLAAYVSAASVWLDTPYFTGLTQRSAEEIIAAETRMTEPTRRPSGLALAQLYLALALARQARPDEAASAAAQALATQRMTSSVLARARELDRALLAGWPDLTEVRDFHERYSAFSDRLG